MAGALEVGVISLAGARRKIGVMGVGASAITVAGVVSGKSQGLGSGADAVAVAVWTGLNEVSTTDWSKGACWSKFGVMGVGLVIDKLDSTKSRRSQKENL